MCCDVGFHNPNISSLVAGIQTVGMMQWQGPAAAASQSARQMFVHV